GWIIASKPFIIPFYSCAITKHHGAVKGIAEGGKGDDAPLEDRKSGAAGSSRIGGLLRCVDRRGDASACAEHCEARALVAPGPVGTAACRQCGEGSGAVEQGARGRGLGQARAGCGALR